MTTLIKQKDDSILRQRASPVPPSLPDDRIKKILRQMREALRAATDGVALAAPQIGIPLRIFIVGHQAVNGQASDPELVFINPQIVKRSRRQTEMIEGCLSVQGVYGRIKRREKVTVKALDEAGRRFTRHTAGLLAQIVQHETDHLDGILFIDKAYDLTKVK